MIKIICFGKIKEKYLTDLILDYEKRIKKYHKLEIIELRDEGIEKERDSILKILNPKDYIISLDINGYKLTSEEFAKKIDQTFFTNGTITFVIGGSDGLHQEVKEKSNYALSFGNLTYPHGLFRGILLEQIYRSFKINNNESYHK